MNLKHAIPLLLLPLALATPSDAALHVLLYGDAGTAEPSQFEVAQAMNQRHRESRFDFGISVGDNWYSDSPHMLPKIFEAPYAPLIASGLVLYQTLGNHDHLEHRDVEELEYAKTHPSFGLPARSYVITRPELKLVVLDVATAKSQIDLPPEKLAWLEKELCSASPEPWKALALHYHLWSTGPRGDNKELQRLLLPLLERCPVDFILSGHEHQAEFFTPTPKTWALIIGNGGARAHDVRMPSEQKSHHFQLEKGFAELNLTATQAQVHFFDTHARVRFSQTRSK